MNFEREQIIAAMERAGLGANQRSRFLAVAHILMRAGAEIKLEEAARFLDDEAQRLRALQDVSDTYAIASETCRELAK